MEPIFLARRVLTSTRLHLLISSPIQHERFICNFGISHIAPIVSRTRPAALSRGISGASGGAQTICGNWLVHRGTTPLVMKALGMSYGCGCEISCHASFQGKSKASHHDFHFLEAFRNHLPQYCFPFFFPPLKGK